MSVILSELKFIPEELNSGENILKMTYKGLSTENDIQLVLLVQDEERVNLKDSDGTFKSSILVSNQLTDYLHSHNQSLTVHVSESTSPRTPVFLKLCVKGTEIEVLGSIYF